MAFSAFVSCSVHPEDESIINRFLDVLKDCNIEPFVLGLKPEVELLREQIRSQIERTDCTIAIMTRRDKIEGRDAWKAPDWVRDESIIAKELGKPLAIFVEEGVEVGGILSENMYVKFSRQNITQEIIDKINYYMRSLASKLRGKENQGKLALIILVIIAVAIFLLLLWMASR